MCMLDIVSVDEMMLSLRVDRQFPDTSQDGIADKCNESEWDLTTIVDDRFELKDLNQKGSLSFLTFVPSNVDYLLTCLKHSRLTTVSKIVGVYHIQYPHSLTGENIKRDIPVLENLFYPPYKSSSTIIHIKSTIQHKDSAIYTSLDRRSLLLQGHTYPVL
ncbi:unnamed protein product [Didymodactylos carnosus]|uniref:Uncharacterized protein n=1 Tax=Didymodactylos carnosus TaxID=1234261 RepID=A0A815H8P5_9BILA|nr:unnamed protein product [Didymodactylos carnosus]CAF4220590.1 unnamed protein product [Didymodactylos carnosus]